MRAVGYGPRSAATAPGHRAQRTSPVPPSWPPQVLVAVAELLGCVSVPCLGSVTERFLLEMGRRIKADSSSPARQQLYWMLQVGS